MDAIDLRTSAGLTFRLAPANTVPGWLKIARIEGDYVASPELIAPAADQAVALEKLLSDRGHHLTAKSINSLRQFAGRK